MKKQLITLALLLATCISASAQKEYKLKKSTGKLLVNLNGALIEGYDGNEIIFSSTKAQDEDEDERAKGLQAISASGKKDNTGLGINVTESGQEVHVIPIGNTIDNNNGPITIRVPKQMAVVFSDDKAFNPELVTIKNVKGEIELTTTYNNIVLENNSGPMNVTTIHGSVDATFAEDIKGPVSIISIYNHVDVALPTTTKANLELGTNYGKLYAANDFDIVVVKDSTEREQQSRTVTFMQGGGAAQTGTYQTPPTPPSPPTVITVNGSSLTSTLASVARTGYREQIKGTVNGGGGDLIFKSTHSNVYLRTTR